MIFFERFIVWKPINIIHTHSENNENNPNLIPWGRNL